MKIIVCILFFLFCVGYLAFVFFGFKHGIKLIREYKESCKKLEKSKEDYYKKYGKEWNE